MTWESRIGAPGNPGGVAAGKTRLLLLGLGESGMSGRGQLADTGDFPAGYPPGDSSVWCLDDSLVWRPVSEPVDDPGAVPLLRPIQDGGGFGNPAEVGFMGFFAYSLQQALGSAYEIGIVNCGKGSSTYGDWAVSGDAATLYANALYKARCALVTPNTEMHSIVLMQGINDAVAATINWDTAWTAIIDQLRIDLSIAATVPTLFVQMPPTAPVDTTYPTWADLRAQQAGWQQGTQPYRRMAVSPDGDIDSGVHLSTAANVVLAQRVMDALFDFRLSVPGAQWSFRRAAAGEGDGGAADNNLVIVGSDAQTIVDIVPQASKAVSEAEYILDAISASQRPALGANGDLIYAAAASDGMIKDPSPLVQSMASRNEMSIYFVWSPDGANQGAFTFSQSASLYWSAWGVSVDAVNCLCRRSGTGPNGARAASAGAYSVDCVTFNATTATFYSDGAPVVTTAVSTLPTSPTRLALGLLSRSGAELQYFLNGGYAEQFGAFAEHDATTVASVSAQLKSYWQGRGLTIP